MLTGSCNLVGIFLCVLLFCSLKREDMGWERRSHTHTHTKYQPNHTNPDNIPLSEMKNVIQLLLTWSILSGMNSPSLLILVNDPFRATWCNSSGMYPGGGELLSLLVGPQRKKIIQFYKYQLGTNFCFN